jgi:hypothetical protein
MDKGLPQTEEDSQDGYEKEKDQATGALFEEKDQRNSE